MALDGPMGLILPPGHQPGRLLGVMNDKCDTIEPVMVSDGKGGEIAVPPEEKRLLSFLADDGYLFWRSNDARFEGMPVTDRVRVVWPSANVVEVKREGREIEFQFFERRVPEPRVSRRVPAPDASGSGIVDDQNLEALARSSWITARSYAMELLAFIEEAPRLLSVMCLVGGACLSFNGLLGALDVFQVFDHAIYYVMNLYAIFFGMVTVVTELHADTTPELHRTFFGVQKWMYQWAKGLTTLWGRGLFNIFQGALAYVGSGTMGFGMLLGVYMIVMGVVYIYLHWRSPGGSTLQNDYIRIDS
eukprot:CAMPEP_0206428442 /NCGR_PEP_ID=MMETSP0324_2-20121206/5669_1 /ASSEMBLY_ACC=CAM_ASM_000836 /TAXON_ID=2866 /ORGANISM="Crypthecodinium cohnii, Strain Seligo" /LENGTH=302 /DNA_ID=CAMNT_0053893975 /DNA_START=54 /DNA_END=962 /DNA_ORIENTATION=-